MTIDFSKFKPEDFLPKFSPTALQSCPSTEHLQTGDLLFPRLRDTNDHFELSINKNLGSDWLSRTATRWEQNESLSSSKKLVDIISQNDQDELLKWANEPAIHATRSLDITALLTEIVDEQNSLHDRTAFSNNNSLYASHSGTQRLKRLFDPNALQQEWMGNIADTILKDPRLIKLIIEILITAGFADLVKQWFNRVLSPTLLKFIKDPLVQLLFDLLTTDDVGSNIFVGHVGIVIRDENQNIYVIEDNITSYSHYRVAIHPYYVQEDDAKVLDYLNRNYLGSGYISTIDFERPAAQASGWVNRRAAMLEYVWHARPTGSEFSGAWQGKLVTTAKALHGRPFGFFDHPELGNNDRMYCSEFVYNVFKHGVSPAAADKLADKMTWRDVKDYLMREGNTKMVNFIVKILADTQYPVQEDSKFFVLPPAILWHSTGLVSHLNPRGRPYAK